MDEVRKFLNMQARLSQVQQPCSDAAPLFLLNDGKTVALSSVQQDGKFGKCLAPRPSVGRAPSPSVGENKVYKMDPTQVLKVSRNLQPVAPENEVLDLTLSSTEKPANIPDLTILEPTVKKHKQIPAPKKTEKSEKRICSPVEIAEPYVDIRIQHKQLQRSKICQEVTGCDQYGISMRVPECDPFKEFPGVKLNRLIPSEDKTWFYYDTEKPLTKPKKKISTFQEGCVAFGDTMAMRQLMDKHKLLVTGTHGIITTEALNPSEMGRYSAEQFGGEFDALESLGEGGFGKVQLCEDRLSKKQFVRKEIYQGFKETEVLLLQQINHINITKLFGFIKRNGIPEIIMEYAGMNLLKFVLISPTSGYINNEQIWKFTEQGLSALEYLDNRGIIHLDVKPENFCVLEVDGEFVLKLTDFGSAKTPQDQLTYTGWTAEYMSPEACISFLQNRFPQKILDHPDYQISGKTDIFSFGLTILFMYSKTHVLMKFFTNGSCSYKDHDRKQIQLQILLALAQRPDIVRELMMPDDCSPGMKELLGSLLVGIPVERPSAYQALLKMKEIKDRENVPLTIKISDDIYEPREQKQKTKSKRVKGSRKNSTSRQSSNSRYSTDSMLVSSGSLIDALRVSLDSYSSLGSPGSPGSPDTTGGPVRCRSVKNKLRQRLSCPYEKKTKEDDNMSCMIPSNSNDINGNFPNFLLLDD